MVFGVIHQLVERLDVRTFASMIFVGCLESVDEFNESLCGHHPDHPRRRCRTLPFNPIAGGYPSVNNYNSDQYADQNQGTGFCWTEQKAKTDSHYEQADNCCQNQRIDIFFIDIFRLKKTRLI